MGVALAALAIGAVGAGVSAAGTAQNASATREQAKFNAYLENKFGKKWLGITDDFIAEKEEALYGLGNIFERFEGGGAFGDTDTLANLRKAQEDFSLLAAGNFDGFSDQLRSIMQDNLVSTFGSGAPIGSYTDLSANALMDLRRTGLDTATAITSNLHNLSKDLLGLEFGVMDQGYNTKYMIDRNRLSAVTGNSMTAAQTAGIGTTAAGNALSSVGSSMLSYGMYTQGLEANRGGMSRPPAGAYGFNPAGSFGGSASIGSPAPSAYRAPIIPSAAPFNYNEPSYPVYATDDYGSGSVLPPYPGASAPAQSYYGAGTAGYGYLQTPGFGLGWTPSPTAPAGSAGYGFNTPFLTLAGSGIDIVTR